MKKLNPIAAGLAMILGTASVNAIAQDDYTNQEGTAYAAQKLADVSAKDSLNT